MEKRREKVAFYNELNFLPLLVNDRLSWSIARYTVEMTAFGIVKPFSDISLFRQVPQKDYDAVNQRLNLDVT